MMSATASFPAGTQRDFLKPALMISLAVHVALLLIRWAPDIQDFLTHYDTPLDVVLVNSRSEEMPVNAQVLAQANLNGGGDADAGRATTPLPVLGEDAANFQIESTLQQQKHIEEMRNTLLRQLETGPNSTPQPPSSVKTQQHSPTLNKTLTPEQQALKTQIARLEAEIARDLEHYAKRPRRAQLTATSAKQALFALYYDGVRRKIEARGTAQFPQEDGQPLYGELVLTLHVNRLGGLGYKKDGWTVEGVKLEKSSGKPALDRQAMAIARSAAPFGVFTQELRERYDVLEIISTFRFTRAGLQTDVAQGSSEDRR